MSDKFIVNMKQKSEKAKSFQEIIKRMKQKSYPIYLNAGHEAFLDFVLAILQENLTKPTLVTFLKEKDVKRALNNLANWHIEALAIPAFSTLVYEGISSSQEILARRAHSLSHLAKGKSALYLASLETLFYPVPSRKHLLENTFTLKAGEVIDPSAVCDRLSSMGYQRAPYLTSLGEFTLKGNVLDIFSYPDSYRLHFDFDYLNDIKLLKVLEHYSHSPQEKIELTALQERVWNQENRQSLKAKFPNLSQTSTQFRQNIEDFSKCRAQELYFGFVEEKEHYLWDFFENDQPIICIDYDQYDVSAKEFIQTKEIAWQKHRNSFPFLPDPQKVFSCLPSDMLKRKTNILIPRFKPTNVELIDFYVEEGKNFAGNLILFKQQLGLWQEEGYEVYVSTKSEAQKEKLRYLFREYELRIIVANFSTSFLWQEKKVVLITEKELFGRTSNSSSALWQDKPTQIIDSFVELKEGSYIVHTQYGIGRFLGLERKTLAGIERDYFALEYAGKEKILIPIEQMNLIQQYIHSGETVSLDKIGSKSWEKRKNKARKKVDDIADHLIELYSQRQQAQGFAFLKDDEWQLAFESAFPYNETPDQMKAMQEIKIDMQATRPMDRLLCGDVGFGKTELAMRAAFKATMSGKQVAVLSPTTILAEQHYASFKERFRNFPISISSLTRFTETKKQRELLSLLSQGKLDILIGTHRLLSKDVQFKDLGLLIIDEEQRFGVKAKEKLKSLRINLDILTLSATPIPRTLHISLVKLRDISTLTTPPVNRKPIETVVAPFSEELVKVAIEKELARKGQIFFLHNRIETLLSTKQFLENLVPYASIECAHGRMSGEELETLMHRFTHNHFQILLSTSIIENGIDIPNANTIIVDQAHLYGLAQLYQLRGRVGRRGEEAFAYLLYPPDKSLSEQAIKRLEVLSENTALGSGFRIAMRDLEIRGIGNLLGKQQSGEIEAVGLDMYLRLLEETMATRLGSASQLVECHLDLSYQGFIPTSYIPCSQEKMEIYKRLAAIKDQEEIVALRSALYDRFGPLPQEMEPFLQVAELRILANRLKITSLIEKDDTVRVCFSHEKDIPLEKFMALIHKRPDQVSLLANESKAFCIRPKTFCSRDKLEQLLELLSFLV